MACSKNIILPFRYLSTHLYDFLEALITQQTSPEEAYKKFDVISSKLIEQLRKCTKQVREALSTLLSSSLCLSDICLKEHVW